MVGAHPHVVEPLEIYKGRAIVYSLGNFMFDQNFSWDTQHGLLLRADFYAGKTRLTFMPVSSAAERSAPAGGADAARTLALLGLPSGVDTVVLP